LGKGMGNFFKTGLQGGKNLLGMLGKLFKGFAVLGPVIATVGVALIGVVAVIALFGALIKMIKSGTKSAL